MSKALMAIPVLLAVAMAQAAPIDIEAAKTLYSNTGTDSGQGIISQSSSNGYFAAAADDFTVPNGRTWVVKEVDVTGAYFNGSGPADSWKVTIYKASHGTVGRAIASYSNLVGADAGGSSRIPIPKTKLKPGVYFISVVANMSFASGEWHWENMLEVHGYPPEWESPNGGGDCQTWTVETKCFGPGIGDHFFALRGNAN